MQHSTHVYKLAPVTAGASRGPRIGCNWIRLGTEVYNPCLPRFYYQILALVRKMGLTAQAIVNVSHLLDCLSRLRNVTRTFTLGSQVALAVMGDLFFAFPVPDSGTGKAKIRPP